MSFIMNFLLIVKHYEGCIFIMHYELTMSLIVPTMSLIVPTMRLIVSEGDTTPPAFYYE